MQSAKVTLPLIWLAVACSAGTKSAPSSDTESANPFMSASTLPFEAPPFDRIHNAHYQPAIEEGMRQQLAEVTTIANDSSPATFENTIERMEHSGALLTRVMRVFSGITQANTNDSLQAVQTAVAPKLAAHHDEIYLNEKLFARVQQLYDARAAAKYTDEQRRLVERYYRDFVRAGAKLSPADKAKLRSLNEEESKVSTDYEHRLLAARNDAGVVITDSSKLAGLSPGDVAAAAEEAKSRKSSGQWVLALQNTTQQPVLASLTDRAVREQVLAASLQRGLSSGANDARPLVARLATLRLEKAKLLGFSTWAAYVLDDAMAKTPASAIKLLTDLVPATTQKAKAEAQRMQQIIDSEHGGFKLSASDWELFAEKVRKADYDLDQAQVAPYFEIDRVLKDGVFFAANKMYGLTFKERKDIPPYHPDVRVFEVFDADSTSLALVYLDYFARSSKSGGAWEDSFVDQSGLLGKKPVVYNVANLTKPAPGQPALISSEDVTTMFHEFGHALHAIFSKVQYPTFSGTNTPRDFVEFPSGFNEHWAMEPTVFANYAKHYQTGQPMPAELVKKIQNTKTFNQGYGTMEYVSSALLDLAWHSRTDTASADQVVAFEQAALAQYKVNLPEVPPRYRTAYFSHIWDGGYSAGYYAYLWSDVLNNDAYEWFVEHGGMTRANGQRFRDMVLSRGGTLEAGPMYRAFRGRDPSVAALLRDRGLTGPRP
ncbi:MAG: M3 family metallopeptidase [Gemmatimonadaceae bacterium]